MIGCMRNGVTARSIRCYAAGALVLSRDIDIGAGFEGLTSTNFDTLRAMVKERALLSMCGVECSLVLCCYANFLPWCSSAAVPDSAVRHGLASQDTAQYYLLNFIANGL